MTWQRTVAPRAPAVANSKYAPSHWVECGYYVQVTYSILGSAIGLSLSFLGAAMLAVLGGFVAIRLGRQLLAILRSVAMPLACGLSFVGVQLLAHGESLSGNEYVREFVPWMVGLVVVQGLALRRGFLHRFAIVAILIAIATLPYLKSFANDSTRTALSSAITIGNPNDLGAWFGFCCVYLTILGLETRRNWIRGVAWTLATGALLVVGLTVSRAPLLALACSIAFAFRRVLKRGFLPFVAFAVFACFAYGFGWFDRAASQYAHRGMEESGRFLVWPLAIERLRQSPLTGVGVAHVETYVPEQEEAVSPHNALIFIGLVSGIVPLFFFVAYWVQLFVTAFKTNASSGDEAPFQVPLLIYSFLIAMNLNSAFMVPWTMATLAAVTACGFVSKARQSVASVSDGRAASKRRNFALLPNPTIR
jgi:O-antigen ligase